MIARLQRPSSWARALAAWWVCLLPLPALGAAQPDRGDRQSALKHFRVAWGRFHLSVALPNPALKQPLDRITMRREAIEDMHCAVRLEPRHAPFLESLAYLCVENRQLEKAELWYRRAARVDPRQPRVPYLLAQVWRMSTDGRGQPTAQACRRADEAYARALRLDPGNGLVLLEAAHLLRQAGREAQARERLERALYRDRYRLYTLPAPPDLIVEEGSPAAAWFALQGRFWAQALSRADEMARWCVSLGRDAESGQRLGAAGSHYRHAVTIGRGLVRAQPRTLSAAVVGLRCQETGLEALAALEKKRGGPETVPARLGRVREAKQAALRALVGGDSGSSLSVKALMDGQADAVERILALVEQSP